jgi:hypothetical protein
MFDIGALPIMASKTERHIITAATLANFVFAPDFRITKAHIVTTHKSKTDRTVVRCWRGRTTLDFAGLGVSDVLPDAVENNIIKAAAIIRLDPAMVVVGSGTRERPETSKAFTYRVGSVRHHGGAIVDTAAFHGYAESNPDDAVRMAADVLEKRGMTDAAAALRATITR